MGDEPEEVEMVEPTLLQQVNQATTLNRTQVRNGENKIGLQAALCMILLYHQDVILWYTSD